MFVTRVAGDTLVDVLVTVAALKAFRTLLTSGRFVAVRVNVATAAVTLAVLAPRTGRAGCNVIKGRGAWLIRFNPYDS